MLRINASRLAILAVLAVSQSAIAVPNIDNSYSESVWGFGTGHFSSNTHSNPVLIAYASNYPTSSSSSSVEILNNPGTYILAQQLNWRGSTLAYYQTNASVSYDFLITGPVSTKVAVDFDMNFIVASVGDLGFSWAGRSGTAHSHITATVGGAEFKMNSSWEDNGTGNVYTWETNTLAGKEAVFDELDTEGFTYQSWAGDATGTTWLETNEEGYAIGKVRITTNIAMVGTGEESDQILQGVAFINPVLSVNSWFLQEHPETSLAFPRGVGNQVVAVPEPSQVANLLLGLLLLGSVAPKSQLAKVLTKLFSKR